MKESITHIHYPFSIDQKLGVWCEEKDFSKHVKQMILQVLLTSPGERINRPDFGCGLRRMIFAPNNDATASLLQVMIAQAMEKWMGDVLTLESVSVNAMDEKLEVKLAYIVKARNESQTLAIYL